MSSVHFFSALSALRLRDWRGVEHASRLALRWLSVHTGIPALVVAAILVVVGWRILKKSLRIVVEIVLVGALLFAATQAGWLRW